jgi:hypothetical protein
MTYTSNKCCVWPGLKEMDSIVRAVEAGTLDCVPIFDSSVMMLSEVGDGPTESSEWDST